MISIIIKYDTIKSYYAKSAMREKKGWNRMSFYKTQELSETFDFNEIRCKCFETFQNVTLKFINGEWWQKKQTNL